MSDENRFSGGPGFDLDSVPRGGNGGVAREVGGAEEARFAPAGGPGGGAPPPPEADGDGDGDDDDDDDDGGEGPLPPSARDDNPFAPRRISDSAGGPPGPGERPPRRNPWRKFDDVKVPDDPDDRVPDPSKLVHDASGRKIERVDTESPYADPVHVVEIRRNLLNRDMVEDLRKLPEDALRLSIGLNKDLGTQSFKAGKKSEMEKAEEYYTQAAIAAAYLCDGDSLRVLLSNRSACRSALGRHGGALVDAETSLGLDPKYVKAWFRKGRALFELGRLDDAESAFIQATRIGNERENAEMKRWRGKISAEREKRRREREERERILEEKKEAKEKKRREREVKKKVLKRHDVDYSKFRGALNAADRISEEEGGPPETRTVVGPGGEELSDGRVASILGQVRPTGDAAGGGDGDGDDDDDTAVDSYFTNDMIFDEFDVEGVRAKFADEPNAIPSTVERAVLMSSVSMPDRLLTALNDPALAGFVRALRDGVGSGDDDAAPDGHCLVLGGGTGLPLVAVAGARTWAGGVTAALDYHSPVLDNLYRGMFAANGLAARATRPAPRELAEGVRGAHLVFGGVPIESLSFDVAAHGSDGGPKFDRAKIPPRADVLVIDPDMFDAGLLGHRCLPIIRHARSELCVDGPRVYPRGAAVYAMPAFISTPDACGLSLRAMDEYRWGPVYEAMDLGSEVGGRFFTAMAPPERVFDFDFEVPKDYISEGMPAEREGAHEFKVSESGRVNAVVFWFTLDMGGGRSVSSGVRDGPKGGEKEKRATPMWKQAVQMIDHVNVEAGDSLRVVASHNLTRARFRVDARTNQLPKGYSLSGPAVHRKALPRWHFAMVADEHRNAEFERAITRAVAAVKAERGADGDGDVHVLDFGCGSGLLGLMAARAGAASVTGVDHFEHLTKVAGAVAKENGFDSDVIDFIPSDIRKVKVGKRERLKRRGDVLIMDMFDPGFLGEGALHFAHHAWRYCLKPDARIVPGGGRVFAVAVQLGRREIEGTDVSHWGSFRYQKDYYGVDLETVPHLPLTEPFELYYFDFSREVMKDTDPKALREWSDSIEVVETGVFNAVVWWHEIYLDEDITISSSPYAAKTCGLQACQMMEEIRVERGELLHLSSEHGGSKISFKYDMSKTTRDEYLALRTDIALRDPICGKMMEFLERLNRRWLDVIAVKDTKKAAYDAILQVALDPGRFSLGQHIDVQVLLFALWGLFSV